jgi:hypothetical protein
MTVTIPVARRPTARRKVRRRMTIEIGQPTSSGGGLETIRRQFFGPRGLFFGSNRGILPAE